jgi:hypothetical protein
MAIGVTVILNVPRGYVVERVIALQVLAFQFVKQVVLLAVLVITMEIITLIINAKFVILLKTQQIGLMGQIGVIAVRERYV